MKCKICKDTGIVQDKACTRCQSELHCTQGGCWFCSRGGDMLFSMEFDTYFHLDCLEKELSESVPERANEEALIIGREHFENLSENGVERIKAHG